MNSLRARVAAIMVVSVILVVCLATVTTLLVMRRAGLQSFVRPMARELHLIGGLAAAQLGSADALRSAPMSGAARPGLQALIREGLGQLGDERVVVVTKPADETDPIASMEVAPGRWLALPVPEEPPPPETLPILGGWVFFILFGTAAVSLLVARVVTRPLVLLEAFAEATGVSGRIELVPETGPAEVRATARALNRLSGTLRRSVESRMRLVAAAGHDLRTPLTRMRLRAEFLDEPERAKWLHNLDELERIADSAILLVREEISDDASEALQLDTVVASIAADLQTMYPAVHIVELQPATVRGPPLALTRAFRNLVVNAATHGGSAELTVATWEGRAVLIIEDRGPGIPEELLDRVFEPFFRVDKGRRQPISGAGLGLAISHEILGRAGATLTLRNRDGGGLRQEVVFALECS